MDAQPYSPDSYAPEAGFLSFYPRGPFEKLESGSDIIARIEMPGCKLVSLNQDCFGYSRDDVLQMSVQEFQQKCLVEESRQVLQRECERIQNEKTRSHWFRIIARHPSKKQPFHYDALLIPVFENGALTELQ